MLAVVAPQNGTLYFVHHSRVQTELGGHGILVYETRTLARMKANGWSDEMLRHPDHGAPWEECGPLRLFLGRHQSPGTLYK